MADTEREVPFVNFRKEYWEIKKDVDTALNRVLESGWFILGPEVESFEREFADFIGVGHAVGVASGTDAITLSLKTLGVEEGDGVVIPANVYPSAFGVALTGATLQLADVDPHTLTLSVSTLEKAVNQNTRAVLAVHLYGNPVDIDGISKFCRAKGIVLVEDCAQATGAIYQGRKVGSFGDISCFSFYPTKNLGAYGDGGMVVTNDGDYARKVRLWRMYGEEARYESILVGHNSRLDEMQASILRAKLKYVDIWNEKRRKIAQRYKQQFSDLPIDLVGESERGKSVYHLFVILVKARDELAGYLKNKGVMTGTHYPRPIHLTPSFAYLGYKEGDFPVSEAACKSVLSLPVYPQMGQDDIEYVVETVRSYYKQ